MSADNYYVIRKHPQGGYTYVMGFASDDNPDLTVKPGKHRQFERWQDAFQAATDDGSEYGISFDADVKQEAGFPWLT